MAINTTGLTGYAKTWADNYNKTNSTVAANSAANSASYGNSSGPQSSAQISQALKGTSLSPATITPKTPAVTTPQTSNIAAGLLSGNTGANTIAQGLLPSASGLIQASPSLIPAKSTINPFTGIDNNNYFNGNGFAYTDKYGFSHVAPTYEMAQEYSKDAGGTTAQEADGANGSNVSVYTDPGKVYQYNGAYSGGYAQNADGERMALPLPGAVNYGNANNYYNNTPNAKPETLLMPLSDFQTQYPNAFGNNLTSGSGLDAQLRSLSIDPTGHTDEEKAYMLSYAQGRS